MSESTASETAAVPTLDSGVDAPIGSRHYRAWVGPARSYDLLGAVQFTFLVNLGLRERHTLLDVGCGSLRGGRFAILYLKPGHYFGIEPMDWLLQEGLRENLGEGLVKLKQPRFSVDDYFTLSIFERTFDFVLAHSIFTHAARPQIVRCMQEVRRVIAPHSIFAGTFHESERDHEGDAWVYPGVTRYTKDGITGIVRDAGLRCIHLDWPHPFNQKWFLATDVDHPVDVDAVKSGFHLSYPAYLGRLVDFYADGKLGEEERPRARSYVEYLEERLVHYSGQTEFPFWDRK